MIDPLNVTHYTRSQEELEQFWIFCIVVAGKNADNQAQAVARLLREKPPRQTPLRYLKSLGPAIHETLVASRTGQYRRIARALTESFALDLRVAAVEDLERIHGVGPKTARFFVLHSRPRARVAVLDTHILKWLRRSGVANVPEHTPGSLKRYLEVEATALELIERSYPGMTLAQADLHIWAVVSGRTAEIDV